MHLAGIQRADIASVWDEVLPLLEPAIARTHGDATAEEVHADLLSGLQQLWVGHEGGRIILAMTTRIDETPERGQRACKLLFLGGAGWFREGHRFFPIILEWARAEGCTEILAWVQRGLYRLLKKLGFQFVEKTKYGYLIFMDTERKWPTR